jgi:hypothetical protein
MRNATWMTPLEPEVFDHLWMNFRMWGTLAGVDKMNPPQGGVTRNPNANPFPEFAIDNCFMLIRIGIVPVWHLAEVGPIAENLSASLSCRSQAE